MPHILSKSHRVLAGIVIAVFSPIIIFITIFTIAGLRRETQTRELLAPPTLISVFAGDVDLYFQDQGPRGGQPIIFIGGTGAWSGFWTDTAKPFFDAGYRTITLDMPPFGFSQRPPDNSYSNADGAKRIVALMDRLEIEQAILVGHSFGGGATIETALTIPDQIGGLILLDVGGLNLDLTYANNPKPNPLLSGFLNTGYLRNPILYSTATNPLFTKYLLSQMLADKSSATPRAVGLLQLPLQIQGTTNAFGQWAYAVATQTVPTRTSDPDNYTLLTMPTLIIWGERDTVIPLSEGRKLQQLISGSQLKILPNVNHIPHLENKAEFVTVIMDFLNKKIVR